MRKKCKVRRIVLATIVYIGISVILSGCSATELEERCFPMLVAVGYEDGRISYGAVFPKDDAAGQSGSKESEIQAPEVTDVNFASSKERYESRLNKEVDYNHMKVLVFEDEIFDKSGMYDDVIDSLMRSEAFPRNTYVCVVDDIEDLFEMQKSISQDLGTYLEEYIKKQEKDKEQLLTLGDLMDEKANQTKMMYLPYLNIEDNYVEWRGYMNTNGKIWKESHIE